MTELEHPRLVALIMQAVDRLLQVEKEQVLEAEGVRLHPSEIHLLLFLDSKPEAKGTEIAERFSVTKGAVSQTLARLESKGVLKRQRREGAPTELSIELTTKGEALMARALEIKGAAEGRFDALFSALSEPEREAVGRFLRLFNER
jgi:DNA-binding MarR family transcriptional regulator